MKKRLLIPVFLILFFALNLYSFNFNISSSSNKCKCNCTCLPNITKIAKEVMPSVVNINTTKIIKRRNPFFSPFPSPFGPSDPFEEFFKKFFGGMQPYQEFKERSLGSGFIISKDGYILTNNHVIANADEIYVTLPDRHRYKAKVVGTDPKTDIALIKINPKGENLKPVKLGDSDKLQVGDWVVAIGNPFGFSRTVTVGIVSAKGRVIGAGPYDDFIQTDAAINPGNSGGPLINMKGEVIGINTAIIASAQGIGFAIPINMAKALLPQLKKGKVVRGWLGVTIQEVTEDLAQYFGMKEPHGALVTSVFPDSPAEKAGIKKGDIILEFDGHKIQGIHDLTRIVATTPVGKVVDVKILRRGKIITLKVKVGEMGKITSIKNEKLIDKLGMYVVDLTDDIRAQYGINDKEGVLVYKVKPGSIADKAGIQPGDIIKSMEYQKVRNLEDYKRILENFHKDKMLVEVKRGNSRIFFVLNLK